MNMFVVIMIVWLAPDGHILAHQEGFAADVPHCRALAEKSIATAPPEVKDGVPKYACWDTRTYKKESAVKLPPGTQWTQYVPPIAAPQAPTTPMPTLPPPPAPGTPGGVYCPGCRA
jgi:hypothetical protein